MSEEIKQDSIPPIPPQATNEPPPAKRAILPAVGEVIISLATRNTYTMGEIIGEGNFGSVYACRDVWNNDLAAKILKPVDTYDSVKASAEAEFHKLLTLRHPFVTYVFDAFEYRDTFYIITERCQTSLAALLTWEGLKGDVWLMPIARCLLQAIHYLHINNYVHQDIHSGNVFTAMVKDEMVPTKNDVMVFKLGDLGVAKVLHELDVHNTRAQWMLPPEVLKPEEFGPIDHRVDIYHTGLLFLELAYSKGLRFSKEEIIEGKPRELALSLQPPLNFALEKALRRHVQYRTADAMELWRDLHAEANSITR